MRSVSSATWTRVLPVSVSLAPNWETISFVRSGVRVLMRRRRVAAKGPSSGDLPGLFDVTAHLLDKRFDRREAPLPAQALDELDLQLLAVQVALPVDQKRLDQLVAAGLELRADPDIDRGRHTIGPRRVDAVPRHHIAL